MKVKEKIPLLLLVLVLVAVGVYIKCGGDKSKTDSTIPLESARHSTTAAVDNVMARVRPRSRRSQTADRVKVDRDPDKKPIIDIEDPEFAELDEFQKEVLKDLQAALDAGEYKPFVEVIERMIEAGKKAALASGSSDWSRFVPLAMKRKAVEALGWFGAETMPEIVGFLQDVDPEIAQDAQMRLEQALQDYDLSDYDLSEIVVGLMKVTTDPDVLDSYYMELARMRNSVMIGTLIEIGQSGTEAAQEKLPENISFYTGDFEIETVEQAEQWLEENPDGEDDDIFYGGAQPDLDL